MIVVSLALTLASVYLLNRRINQLEKYATYTPPRRKK